MTICDPEPFVVQSGPSGFFQNVDWLSLALTTSVALSIYLFTLAPEVTAGSSGIYATAAMYPSGSIPSGHPLSTIYGWAFIQVLPFSNIAWRVTVSSAVAGALASGLVALVVSRTGARVTDDSGLSNALSSCEKAMCRVMAGVVAGLGLAFDGGLWCKSVTADTWPLSVFFFALTLCFLSRWFFDSERRRYLYAAAFVHGLNLCESQAFIPAAFGLPFLVALGDPKLGRQIFLGLSVCLWSVILMKDCMERFGWHIGPTTQNLVILGAMTATLCWTGLVLFTRKWFGDCKATTCCAAFFLVGLSFYFLLPVFSMTNPPVNWGYPRTIEGFFHVLSRGQFESLEPVSNSTQLLVQWEVCWKNAAIDFGYLYLIAAVIPLFFLANLSWLVRRWFIGLLLVWFVTNLVMMVALNVNQTGIEKYVSSYFVPTRLILAMLGGVGLMLVSMCVAAKRSGSPSANKAAVP